ncbi:MAG: hypothetical protein ISS51_02195 [Dehalococcoidales bacterium]|nr:hypothetical protein [Dehalococcoidales bacterium]
MTDIQKVKVSRKQFAGLLDYWLWGFLSEKAVKKTAKDLGFKIRTNEDFSKIFEELFVLDMWLVVYTCEGIFEDEDKRNECLDIFHHLEYGRYLGKEEKSFSDWMMSIAPRYAEYGKAMETEHPSTPLWVVANVFNKRLFGETKNDLAFQTKVIVYKGLFVKHLGEAIKQYDID